MKNKGYILQLKCSTGECWIISGKLPTEHQEYNLFPALGLVMEHTREFIGVFFATFSVFFFFFNMSCKAQPWAVGQFEDLHGV